jgi:hypothetical protein
MNVDHAIATYFSPSLGLQKRNMHKSVFLYFVKGQLFFVLAYQRFAWITGKQ